VSFFDFSAEVQRAVTEAPDDTTRWCVRTEIGRRLFPGAVERAGFFLLQPRAAFSPAASEHVLVVGAASWSDPDLVALDRVAQHTRNRNVHVVVFDVDCWPLEDILRAFPGRRIPRQHHLFSSTNVEPLPTLAMGTKLSCGSIRSDQPFAGGRRTDAGCAFVRDSSAVGLGAMADAEDAHGVVFESEQDTVISESEPERSRHIAVQRIHVAGASSGKAENPFKQPHGGSLVHRANVGLGFVKPLDPVR
jgi:hypothetical protein